MAALREAIVEEDDMSASTMPSIHALPQVTSASSAVATPPEEIESPEDAAESSCTPAPR